MNMKKIAFVAMLCAVGMTAMAKPAYRGPIVRTMEDGTEKIVYLHGNEDFHYMTDANGAWLEEATLQPMTEMAKGERLKAKGESANVRRAPQAAQGVGDEPNIAPRGLLILVNFPDKEFTTPKDTIDSMLNGENYTRNYSYKYGGYTYDIHSEGSVRKYFEDQSFGAYSPVFDVVGPVTMSREMSYYGSNDRSGSDKHPEEMVIEACDSANIQFGVDFTQYDNDNDGFVDFVYVIYAGYGEADGAPSTTIWPHQWNIYDYGYITHSIDGKILNRYACGNELSYFSDIYDGIGTICHEFSHVLGLPDLYSTEQGSTHKTMGAWDIMDYGPYNNDGNTPPSYSAYERFYMGWITPRVLNEPENVTLHPLNESQEALLLCDGNEHNMVGWNPVPKNFYLLEVRRLIGWDEYLPGQGMLLTKIQFNYNKWASNIVNNNASSQGVDLIEADGKSTGSGTSALGKAGDAFPNGKKYWYGYDDHDIENIARKANGVITFDYRGGAAEGVEEIKDEKANGEGTKVIENGVLYLKYNGTKYNVQGVRVE